MKQDMGIPEGSEVLVATDYMIEVIEGRTDIIDRLEKLATRNDIVLIKSVVCEGLERADNATAEGLHALGRLITVSSKIINHSEDDDEIMLRENEKGIVEVDTLLMCLIGTESAEEATLGVLRESWFAGIMPYTKDYDLVSALLAVKEGDKFNIKTFSSALKAIYIDRHKDTIAVRLEKWYMTEKYAKKLRNRAMTTDMMIRDISIQ